MANVLGKALKTDLNKPPAISAGEDYMKSVEPTLKELKGAEEQKLKFEKEKSIQTAESEAEKAKSFSSAKEGEIKSLREDPARAELEGLMGQKAKAEFIPTQENAKDMATLFSLMNVIGFAIGAGGKQHAQQAMSAMNGMLEGHQKGRDDLYRQERNIFDINQKLLDKKIDGLFKFMQENSKLYTKDKELAEQNAMVKFAEEGAGFLKAYYEKNGPGPTLEYMKQLVKAKEHAADLTDREKTRAQQAADRLQREREAAALKTTLAGMKAAKPGKDYSSVSELVQDKTGARLKDKDAEQVAIAANALGDASAIKQIVKDHPEWVGRTGQIKNFFNRTLDSINLGTPAPDDAGQPELVFAKRYAEYLANYERALAGGARGFTVYFQRRFNQLLEQNQFNASGMENLMDEQMRTITSQVASKGKEITRDSLMNLAKDIKERAGDEDAIKGMSGTKPAAKPTESSSGALTPEEQAELKALKEKHGR